MYVCLGSQYLEEYKRCQDNIPRDAEQFFCGTDKEFRSILHAKKVSGGPLVNHCKKHTPRRGILWLRDSKDCNMFYSCDKDGVQTNFNSTGKCESSVFLKHCPAAKTRGGRHFKIFRLTLLKEL